MKPVPCPHNCGSSTWASNSHPVTGAVGSALHKQDGDDMWEMDCWDYGLMVIKHVNVLLLGC